MKKRSLIISIISILAIILLMTGCNVREAAGTLDAIENSIDNTADSIEKAVEDTVKNAVSSAPQAEKNVTVTPSQGVSAEITPADAEEIALAHAGFTTDQISHLRTEYEIDDGVPQYEIEFYQDFWEYDYTIHAETGAILSFDKDD